MKCYRLNRSLMNRTVITQGDMKEYIIFVRLVNDKKILTGKMLTNRFISPYYSGENMDGWKLVYFEFKANKRSAETREKKLRTLKKNILMDFVRKSNPELLDLKYTITGNKIIEELIY